MFESGISAQGASTNRKSNQEHRQIFRANRLTFWWGFLDYSLLLLMTTAYSNYYRKDGAQIFNPNMYVRSSTSR